MLTHRRSVFKRYGMGPTDRLAARTVAARQARFRQLSVQRVPGPVYMPRAAAAAAPMAVGRFQGGSAREVKCFDCTPVQAAAGGGITWGLSAVTSGEPGAAFVGMTCLNEVLQSATVYGRVGAKILMKSIRLRAQFYLAADPSLAWVRVAVIYDRQPNGAYPLIGDIFADANTGAVPFSAGLNITNKGRFTVFRDQVIPFDSGRALTWSLDWFMNCRLQTEYKASAGSIADITTGSLLLVIASLNQTSNPVFGTGSVCSRIRYDDT